MKEIAAQELFLTEEDDTVIHPSDEIIQRALIKEGDLSRLWIVMDKAMRGESITVAVTGGSITYGSNASVEDKRWANLVGKWWKKTFPQTEIMFLNTGIGATGSNLAVHRACRDLLIVKPDVVIVEYALNDTNEDMKETYEGLIRQIMAMDNNPAVVGLMTMNEFCKNAQESHVEVLKYYELPTVSFRDAYTQEVTAKRIEPRRDLMPDGEHPNDFGHQCLADFITVNVFDRAYKTFPDINKVFLTPLRQPLTSDVFQFARLLTNKDICPIENFGWAEKDYEMQESVFNIFGASWITDIPCSNMKFEVDGRCIGLCYFRGVNNMGIIEARVDDLEPVKIDCCFVDGWGDYWECVTIAKGLSNGKHTLEIKITDERNQSSKSLSGEIFAILEAGLR